MAELARAQTRTAANLDRLESNLDRLESNLHRLSAEMREFKNEMAEFKNETRAANAQMRQSSEASDRRWGELSNKMGTLVEDFIAPGIPTIFRQALGIQDEPDFWIRSRRTHPRDRSRRREFDAVALGGGFLFVNETKSTLRPEDIPLFREASAEAREYWPEARGDRVQRPAAEGGNGRTPFRLSNTHRSDPVAGSALL